MVLNPFTYTIFQSSSNRERTDSRRGLNTDETRLKSPLVGEGGGGGGGWVFTFSWVSTQPLVSWLVWTTKARQQGVELTLNCWCFMRAHHYSVEGAWQETYTQTNLIYRKIPKISPGAYIFQRPFLRGLFLEGLIYGGEFAFQNRLG